MDILVGNAHDADTRGTGWFLGFSEWTHTGGGDLLHVPQDQDVRGVSMKWFDHPPGHDSGGAKPLSEGRTVSILVSEGSEFRIDFCDAEDFSSSPVKTAVLRRHGDFAAWGAGVYHRWHCVARSTVLTLRFVIAA